MAVSKRVRFEVFKRDKFTCQYCGKRPPDVVLEADHIVPKCEGGSDEIDNLTTACAPCNRGKSGVPLSDVAPALDEMERLASMQEMLERKQLLRQTADTARAKKEAEALAVDLVLEWWTQEFGDTEVVQKASLRRFVSKLDLDQLSDAVGAAAGFYDKHPYSMWRVWKYFCGVCWTKIRSTEADADEGDADG